MSSSTVRIKFATHEPGTDPWRLTYYLQGETWTMGWLSAVRRGLLRVPVPWANMRKQWCQAALAA
jgi:hypothetical protein